MNLRTLPAEEAQDRTLMEGGWPAAGHMMSVSNYGNEADTHRRESSVPMELNNSEVRESHSPSTRVFPPERMPVYYPTPTTNLGGVSIGRMHSCDVQQALVRNMTSHLGGGLSWED